MSLRTAGFRLIASLALIGLVLALVGPAQVAAAFAHASPAGLATGFAAAVTATLASALRWHALAIWFGLEVSRTRCIIAYWRGITANTVLPGAHLGGDALRAWHLHQAGHPLGPATLSVAFDRLSGLWILVVISLTTIAAAEGTGILPAHLIPWPWSVSALLAVLSLLMPVALWALSTRLAPHLPTKPAALLRALHERPRPLRQYVLQLAGSGAVQAFSILAFACGAQAIGLSLPFWIFLIAAGPIFILAALPVSVGGWGTREAAAAVTLGLFGAPRELAVAAALIYGLFAALQGLLGALTFLRALSPPSRN